MDNSTVLSLNMIGRSIKSVIIYERDFDKVSYMTNFRVNVWTKSMLSVPSSKKSCLIEVMFYFIEFISFFLQRTKETNTK